MRTCEANNCSYPVFGTDKVTRVGYCKSHQHLRTDKDKRSPIQKHFDSMKEKGLVNKNGGLIVSKAAEYLEQTELQKWYAAIMEKEEGRCWETGERINKQDKKGWHGSIAHILPKGDYDSVKTHPLNYMILKMWGGTHGQYDSSWENASKMKVWPYAVKIINQLFPLLTKEEKGRLPDVVLQEIKPEIYNGK